MEQFFALISTFFVDYMYIILCLLCFAGIYFAASKYGDENKYGEWCAGIVCVLIACLFCFSYRVGEGEFAVYVKETKSFVITEKGLHFEIWPVKFLSTQPIQICDEVQKYRFGVPGQSEECKFYQVVPGEIDRFIFIQLPATTNSDGKVNSFTLAEFVHTTRNDPKAPRLPFVKVIDVP